MSEAPFEFSYQGSDGLIDLGKTTELCALIDEYTVAEYGDDMVFGVLAFDDDKNFVGIRIEAHGDSKDRDTEVIKPHGEEGFDEVAEWVRSLGVEHLFGFVRRGPDYGHGVEAGAWDHKMADTGRYLSAEAGLHYQGHIIFDGTDSQILPGSHPHLHQGVETLLNLLPPELQATIATQMLAKMRELDPTGLDPEVYTAIEDAIAHVGDKTEPTSEADIARFEAAIDAMVERGKAVHNGAELTGPSEPTTDTVRPNVPRIFYN
jgi:hypothetical protein